MNQKSNRRYRYRVGGSLSFNHPTYVTREADDELLDALLEGRFCYVFNCRQMGKSSLLNRTMSRLQTQGMSCVKIDLTGIGAKEDTVSQWYGGLILDLSNKLNLEAKFNREAWEKEFDGVSPVYKLNRFIQDVVLVYGEREKIFIFIDEIDKIISLDNKLDDFFGLIRYCYNQREENPEYHRLTFALSGVATPSDLITDKTQTPFNIGYPVELTGLKLADATPLVVGLEGKVESPEVVMGEILNWTGGQPFLTQRVCQLVVNYDGFMVGGREREDVANLVRLGVIENWQSQDETNHLGTIRDRILTNEQRAGRLLGLYRDILQRGYVAADDTPEQTELRLSGLVVKQNGNLRIYNLIYAEIFNLGWVEESLRNLRPYSLAMDAWFESNCQDESRLLRGETLQEALAWKADKSLSLADDQFLDASREFDRREMKRELAVREEKSRILTEAYQQAEWQKKMGLVILVVSLIVSALAGVAAVTAKKEVKIAEEKIAEADIALESASSKVLFLEDKKFDALLVGLRAGKQLKQRQKTTASTRMEVVTSLHQAVYGVKEYNSLEGHKDGVLSVSFSPDGKTIASGSRDGTIKLWNLEGKELLTLMGHKDWVTSVSFSPDGQTITSGSRDDTVKLWNLEGKELLTLTGHKDWVTSVSFSPDGQTITSGSRDGTVKLWNLEGKKLLTLIGHRHSVYSVNFSPDGQTIASGSEDRTVILWDLSLDSLMAKGCRWVGGYLKYNPNVSRDDRGLCEGIVAADG